MADNLYEKLGASASKAGLHRALKSAGAAAGGELFAQVTDDAAGSADHKSFIHCDGAGTKSVVAYLLARETGDVNHYAGLAQDALVMNLDDVYCLGAPSSMVLANTIARNARVIGDNVIAAIVTRYRELTESLRSLGVPIALSGGETADMGDVVRTLVVDAVLSGRIEKRCLIDTRRIAAGDVIVGLESTGRAEYEDFHNSGIGSNGLTLARHALLKREYAERDADAADPAGLTQASYSGPYSVSDRPRELGGASVGEALLSPTRTYAPLLAKIYAELADAIHAAIHVTGGGLTKILRFGPGGLHFIKDDLFPVPPIFSLIQRSGGVSWKEMYGVFNMGQRMELYVPPSAAGKLIKLAADSGIAAKVIGRVESSENGSNCVTVKSEHGEFDYGEQTL